MYFGYIEYFPEKSLWAFPVFFAVFEIGTFLAMRGGYLCCVLFSAASLETYNGFIFISSVVLSAFSETTW